MTVVPRDTSDTEYVIGEYYARSNSPEANSPNYYRFRIYKRRLIWSYMQRIFRERGNDRALRILDVGCADGSELDYVLCQQTRDWSAADAVRDWRVCGVDAHTQCIALAAHRADQLQKTVPMQECRFFLADITAPLPFEEADFDVAICSEVVEHLPDPESLLTDIQRVLAPGGYLIFTTDNEPTKLAELKHLVQRLAGRRITTNRRFVQGFDVDGSHVDVHGHINTKPCTEWERILRRVGFELLQAGPYESALRKDLDGAMGEFASAIGNFVVRVAPVSIAKQISATTAILCQRPKVVA